MCNDENSFLFDQTGKSALNQRFVLDVQTCGGLVQKNDRGVFQKGPCDGDTLPFTAGKFASIFSDHAVVTVRKPESKLFTVCQSCGSQDFSVCGVFSSDPDILHDCIIKQGHVLKDDGVKGKQCFRIHFGDVHTSHGDGSTLNIPETGSQTGDGCLAAAGRADQGSNFPLLCSEGYVF